MLRREFSLALCSFALAPYVARSSSGSRGPLCWLATRGKARVFLLGFGDAKDKAWLTPLIQRAFQESSQLWLEVGSGPTPDNRDAAAKQADADRMREYEHESGRTFFDALQPAVRARVSTYIETLGIKRESIETLRPWKAFYVINSAYWSHTKLPYEEVYVDEVLTEAAVAQGKSLRYETPTPLDFARFMASMPDAAQSEYIDWLLDFIDERRSGSQDDAFDWYVGKPAAGTRSLHRMRSQTPDLYKIMQVRRNAWWAQKINDLLGTGGTYFIGIGELHVLGPDGIPRQLQRLGVVAPSDLQENPALGRLG